MKKRNKNVIIDQEYFFDQNALQDRTIDYESVFYNYINKEQLEGLKWIEDRQKILEYGCSVGNSLELFFKTRDQKKYSIYGVDISGGAIKKISKKYPKYHFYKISNNKIPQIKNGTIDAVFITHVLHHSHDHQDIFNEIHKKLKKGGKFLINDLSSNNPINRLGRIVFVRLPKFMKNKFSDDLVVGETIPDKYKVDINDVVKQLKETGFKITKIGHGHLFFFVFDWIDKFIPFSKIQLFRSLYKGLIKFEYFLLKYNFFQKKTEVFSIQCVKK